MVVRVGVGEEGRQLYVRRLWKEEGEGRGGFPVAIYDAAHVARPQKLWKKI